MLASDFVYGYPFAGPQGYRYGNGRQMSMNRNLDYRPDQLIDGPREVQTVHDEAGNIVAQTHPSGPVQNYGYDANDRLIAMTDSAPSGFGSLGWEYDPNGNRTGETRNGATLNYLYSPADSNWLAQAGGETRTRTPDGNTAFGTPIGTLSYDGYGRLAQSGSTRYEYNALGERVKKLRADGSYTLFHYGSDGELLYERDSNGASRVYVWLDGRPLARIDNDTAIYYYHTDHLGTPQAMTDAAGQVVWQADYEPFGKAVVKVNTVQNNLRLPGQYFDAETGLHYNIFRDYDPGLGRYIQADPIGLAGGLNLYAYVDGNPVSDIDPYGLFNYAKGAVALTNGIIGGISIGAGAASIVGGVSAGATGVGLPATVVAVGFGASRVNAGIAALRRAKQQLNEARKECSSDASWKNLAGLLPFGQHFDDPGESLNDFGQQILNQPFSRQIIDLLTYGPFGP